MRAYDTKGFPPSATTLHVVAASVLRSETRMTGSRTQTAAERIVAAVLSAQQQQERGS